MKPRLGDDGESGKLLLGGFGASGGGSAVSSFGAGGGATITQERGGGGARVIQRTSIGSGGPGSGRQFRDILNRNER